MSTPHNRAEKNDIAKTVLMPGDPLRAKFIAESFLEEARLVNDVRGMFAYTGKYKGSTVSVMASGMGMPSIGIYSYELFNFYDVENIIRVGTAGGISEELQVGDVVLGIASCTPSSYSDQFGMPCQPPAAASYSLLRQQTKPPQKWAKRFTSELFSAQIPSMTNPGHWESGGISEFWQLKWKALRCITMLQGQEKKPCASALYPIVL